MSDISGTLTIISSLVVTITSSVNRVKFNKRICERLARKCTWLEELLENGDLGSPTNSALKQLVVLPTVCDKDLKKFASSGFLLRIIRSGGIPGICEAHLTELDDWIARIRETNNTKAVLDAAESAEDDDEFDQEDAMRYDVKVSKNQKDARDSLLSDAVLSRLLNRAIVDPDYLGDERKKVGTFPFGTICQGTYRGEAVYIRELRSDIPDKAVENIKSAISLAQCLSDCSNIVPIYGTCGGRMIVTAMPANGPLNEYPGKLTTVQKVTFARQVTDALVFMVDISAEAGRKSVVHRDIRAANILLSDNLEPMLTGFELCKGDGDLTGFRPEVEDSLKRWWPRE
ncbi:Tyrosine-protein kinase ZAP-70 [Mortierella sp. AD032]|nr:Tyrosine-protein kinase ZAP-70 [Mortierella sp. AD032]